MLVQARQLPPLAQLLLSLLLVVGLAILLFLFVTFTYLGLSDPRQMPAGGLVGALILDGAVALGLVAAARSYARRVRGEDAGETWWAVAEHGLVRVRGDAVTVWPWERFDHAKVHSVGIPSRRHLMLYKGSILMTRGPAVTITGIPDRGAFRRACQRRIDRANALPPELDA